MHRDLWRTTCVAGVIQLGLGGVAGAQSRGATEPDSPRLDQPHESHVSPPAQAVGDRALSTSVPVVQNMVIFDTVGILSQVNVTAEGLNQIGDAANEPSIAVNPLNPNQIAIGWRQFDTVFNSFREAGVAFSNDGGQTWTRLGDLEAGIFRSDPVLNFNNQGVFFYNSLKVSNNNVFDTWIFRSFDGGATWGSPIFAYGGDKQWMAVDRTGGGADGAIYQAWNTAANQFAPSIFNRSYDDGATWTLPSIIPGSPRFGELAVGPGGEVYVAGITTSLSSLVVVRSDDAKNPLLASPTFPQSALLNLNGGLRLGSTGTPNPAGLLGPLNIDIDRSPERSGWVYVLGSTDPPGTDPLDVRFARSTDGGVTFSASKRINDDSVGSGSWHWFGTMSVSPDGRIDAIWLDTRDDSMNQFSALYYAFSLDGGFNWSVNIPLTVQFNHSLGFPQQNKLGDYFDMISDNDGANLAFAATFNGEQDVYFMRINYPPCTSEARDCNANGLPDDCEVQVIPATDSNFDGIPNECETGICQVDVDLNGEIGFGDITVVLANWGEPGSPQLEGDANGDNMVAFDDITLILSQWLNTCP